jgi:hypothetical protein
MGLGTAGLALYRSLESSGLLHPPMRVCDLGSQDVYEGSNSTGSARDLMEKRGYGYCCIDIDGRHGAWRMDLNTAKATGEYQFDVVTNHGTTEHVFDQANVFCIMHDLCALDGLMIHMVPSKRYGSSHGFYYYDKVLFRHMAACNKYETIKLEFTPDPNGELVTAVFRKRTSDDFALPIQDMYAAPA